MLASNSIIIYRSRTEQEFDRLIWDGDGSSIAVMGYIFAMLLAFVAIYMVFDKCFSYKYKSNNVLLWASALLSVPVGYGFGKLFGWFILWI
jgi:hypothetical protein